MNSPGALRRSLSSRTPTALAAATVALTALAAVAAYLARWPCCTRLRHRIFERLFAFDDFRSACLMVAVIAGVLSIRPLQRAGASLVQEVAARPRLLVVAAFAAMAVGSQVIYLNHALAMDEYAPRFQAHAFATGHLAAHWPVEILDRIVVPFHRGFFLFTSPTTGLTTSVYWPGLALLMTPLAVFDLEWLLNPALSALALWLIYRISTELAGDRQAGAWAMMFAVASPAFLVNGMSFYAMPGLLALDLLFAWLLMRQTTAMAGLAGLVGGLALVLHNPFPHIVFAIPWLLWLVADRQRWRQLAAALAGYVPLGVGLGLAWPLFNARLGIDPAAMPHAGQAAGDGWLDRLLLVFHWPGALLMDARIDATWKLWIWACPGMLVLCAMAVGRRLRAPWAWLLVSSFLLTYLAYFLVAFDQGHGWGYRYVHSAWGVLPILAGIFVAERMAAPDGERWRHCCGGLVLAGLLVLPYFLWQAHANISENVRQVIAVPAQGYWAVFVTPQAGLYTGDVIQNFPGRSRVLTLYSEGQDADRALIAHWYPGAQLVVDDSRGSAWRLCAPPLPLQPRGR